MDLREGFDTSNCRQHYRARRPRRLLSIILTLTFIVGGLGTLASEDALARIDEPATESPPPTEEPVAVETPLDAVELESTSEGPTEPDEAVEDGEPEPIDSPEVVVEEPDEPVVLPADDESVEAPVEAPVERPELEIEPPAEKPPAIAPSPTLIYAPAESARCLPADAQPEIVAHGAFIVYDCTYEVELAGEHVAPSSVQVDWTVETAVNGGWEIQLAPPLLDPAAAPEWTADDSASARFEHRDGIADGAASDAPENFETTRSLAFGLRVHRIACGKDVQAVRLDVAVGASLPGVDAASVEARGRQPEAYTLSPALAPIPEPTMTFSGSLDFGEIGATTEGPLEQPAPQDLIVTVDGLDQACGLYHLALSSSTFDGSDGSEMAASSLKLDSINGEVLPNGGCAFDGGCRIAAVQAGADVAPTATYTLGVSLVIPDQARVAVFNSTLTASLEHANPALVQASG